MEEKVYKKFYREADKHLNGQIEAKHGKKEHQKMKPFVVLQYLLKYTDENNAASAYDIIGFLEEHGLTSERRSIYHDIEEINQIMVMLEEDCEFEEAEELLKDDEDLKTIVYDPHRKGFYVKRRSYEPGDIRLIAECVYSAKFIAEGQAKQLADVVCEFVSVHQAEKIRHNAFLTDRVKTNNKSTLITIDLINEAMSRELNGEKHTPEKISFKYLQYSINDLSNQVERRHGSRYVVSPFSLLINDGNYYLLAFEDASGKMKTYRIDRMKDVRLLGEPRAGEDMFDAIDLKSYTRRTFSMFSGKERQVEIRCINPLLDTVVERFGTKDARYTKVDERHFTVTATVSVSEPFYGWLLSFGRRMKLISPEDVVNDFRVYVEKVSQMYE